jgi:hypothetical protein
MVPVRVPAAGTREYATDGVPGVAPEWSRGTVTAPHRAPGGQVAAEARAGRP